MSNVIVLATGGTIASRYSADQGAIIASVTADELIGGLGEFLPGITVSTEQIANVGSFRITFDLAFNIVCRVNTLLAAPDVSGIVVTCGTDTMEEVAYLSDLLVTSDKPVVFTGAQRNADEPDTDGPRNLRCAILVAASQAAIGLGTTIVFEDEIHAARDVTKTHTSRSGTFASAEHGKLGEIDGKKVIITRRPIRQAAITTNAIEAKVDLVKLYMGSDSRFIDCAVASGSRGLVLEAFGRGNGTPEVVSAVGRAIQAGITVVVTSRCPQGRVAPLYSGGGGGGHDLLAAGAIFAGDLTGIKARVLLGVLLGAGMSPTAIAESVTDRGN
jgi:L-asparaginase